MAKEKTRLQIITVASRLFAQNGFGNTSMNDIVHATGLSKGGIYWHFKSKDEIVEAIFDQYFQAQITSLVALKQDDSAIDIRIRRLVKFIGDELGETVAVFPEPLEFYAHALRQENLLNRLRDYFATYTTHLAELIQQGIDSGEFSAVNPLETAHILLSSLEGIILIDALTSSEDTLQSQLMLTAELLLRGLKNPTEDTAE